MNLRYRPQFARFPLLGLALCAQLVCPNILRGQEPPNVTVIVEDDGTRHDLTRLRDRRDSRFRLFGEADRAFAGMRALGNMEYFVTNTGIIDAADMSFDVQPDISGCVNCGSGVIGQWFDVSPIYAAPRSDWERFVEQAPSLLSARGGGYSVAHNGPTLGFREILASDHQIGTLFSGAVTTTDGSCLDHSGGNPGLSPPGESGNQAPAGVQLLAISDCPPTWPTVSGTPTFLGDHPVPTSAWKRSQAALGPEFNFDWWRVDSTRVDRTRLLGDHIQTYGAYDDYNSAMIGRFGAVVPGGAGAPDDPGWPLGLRTEFNAFNFKGPRLSNSMFWRAIIINRTQEVYGVGLDYENLYVGYSFEPIRNSEMSFYMEVWRGAILSPESGTGSPQCPGTQAPDVGNNSCGHGSSVGFEAGATGQIVLKSPIGDLRNVLLSCSPAENPQRTAERALPCPTDEFFDPGNPHAGDTITYNHFRMCDFGGCTTQIIQRPERQWFGGIASKAEDVLNGRDAAELRPRDAYNTFRNPNFPDRRVPFTHWVPGTWDYTANGPTPGGDTIWVPTCYGPPGVVIQGTTRENRSDACTVTWSDTMPVGELGNPAYHNEEGNISFWSVGPFRLAAGDTTALVIALVAGIDSTGFELEVNSVIEHYLSFYPIPKAPDPVAINVIDIEQPRPDEGRLSPAVSLFWDDAAETWVDPFLADFADRLAVASAGPLARMRALNPRLEDQIRARAADNLRHILIYKSCNDGRSFTAADVDARGALDCDGDPTIDRQGQPIDPGWQAYAALGPNEDGDFPNAFRDSLVLAGQSYLYIVAGETRGGIFLIDDSLDTDADRQFDAVGPDSLVVAPRLINPLTASADAPNQATVYVPASVAAGGARATVTLVGEDPSRSNEPFEIRPVGTDAVEGLYRAVFANRFEAEEVRTKTGEAIETRVSASDIRTVAVETSPRFFVGVDSAVEVVALRTQNPNSVQFNAAPDDSLSRSFRQGASRDTVLTQLDEFGFLLYSVEGEAPPAPSRALAAVPDPTTPGEPLLVSSVLDGANTTPPAFLSRESQGSFSGFPGFVINAEHRGFTDFLGQVYRTADSVEVIADAAPTLRWIEFDHLGHPDWTAFGDYVITWHDRAFGPGEPFRIDSPDSGTDVVESLRAREAASISLVNETAAAAIGVPLQDLIAVELPFTIRNETFDRDVGVAIRNPGLRSLLLGDPDTGDTLVVEVPQDAWIPDDAIHLIETVETDSFVATSNGGAVVLRPDGTPVRAHPTIASFRAVLDCGSRPRPTCNPVVGPGSTHDWIPVSAGLQLVLTYSAPFQLHTEIAFRLDPPVGPGEALAAGRNIRFQMDSIKAVPNPYIVASQYQVGSADRRLLFTHLPPRGTLRIFTVSGQFVQQLKWEPSDLSGNGDLFWDMVTREGLDLAAGLYVFVVEARNPASGRNVKKVGKFVVIR